MEGHLALEGLAKRLARVIRDRLGIATTGEVTEIIGGHFATVRFTDLEKPSGLSLVVTNAASRVSVETVFDSFSKPLIQELSNFNDEDLSSWAAVCKSIESEALEVTVSINGRNIDPANLPAETIWDSFSLEVSSRLANGRNRTDSVIACGVAISTLLFTLMTVEEDVEEEVESEITTTGLGEEEGRKMRITINRYERSRKNRSTCLAIYGFSCFSCGILFEKFYGNLGAGYIEVHHRNPVSMMGGSYRLDPAADLVPLCANCHRMVHREWPPISPEALREIVVNERSQGAES